MVTNLERIHTVWADQGQPLPVAVVHSIFEDVLSRSTFSDEARPLRLEDLLVDARGQAFLEVPTRFDALCPLILETLCQGPLGDNVMPPSVGPFLAALERNSDLSVQDAEQLRAWMRAYLGPPADHSEVAACVFGTESALSGREDFESGLPSEYHATLPVPEPADDGSQDLDAMAVAAEELVTLPPAAKSEPSELPEVSSSVIESLAESDLPEESALPTQIGLAEESAVEAEEEDESELPLAGSPADVIEALSQQEFPNSESVRANAPTADEAPATTVGAPSVLPVEDSEPPPLPPSGTVLDATPLDSEEPAPVIQADSAVDPRLPPPRYSGSTSSGAQSDTSDREVVRHEMGRVDRPVSVPVAPAARRSARPGIEGDDSLLMPAEGRNIWVWAGVLAALAGAMYMLFF